MRVGVLLSRVRVEEKLLFEALEKRRVDFDLIDDRKIIFELQNSAPMRAYDVILERCINHSRALYALELLNAWGIRTVNTYEVANICGNKFSTTRALIQHQVPTPRT
ncbi:MAG: 30S ribosomal protein S6--L-glutamate ligase, partial [Chloroflexi bacterium]|nr:30S ribosomal protein S6--L-glutamate ligase [Chloroflexota bacterium]